MINNFVPGSYEYTFGELSAEEKEQMAKDDIPTVIVGGKVDLTDEQKNRAEQFLKNIRENKIKNIENEKCKKCGVGIMQSKSNGRAYVCSNPNCKTVFWVYMEE